MKSAIVGLGNSLLPDANKLLLKPVMVYNQWDTHTVRAKEATDRLEALIAICRLRSVMAASGRVQ